MWVKKVAVVFILVALAGAELCTEKNCTCVTTSGKTYIDCQSKDLTLISNFSRLPDNVISIDFSKNKITSIPILEEIDGLKTLKFSYNEISDVDPEAFSKYNYLEHLDLCHNHIPKLTGLQGLSGLRSLNLSYNYLRSLPDDIFSSMGELVELRLAGNPLHYLRYEWFRILSKVTVLDVSECALSSLPSGAFHDMILLTDLDLSRNTFEQIPSDELKSAQKLQKLKMNGNQLETIHGNSFKKCKHLEELELSDMGTLQKIKPGAFAGLKLLKVLRITHNPNLKEIHFGAFEGLFNGLDETWSLNELILRENGVQGFRSPSKNLCKIPTVDLQGNPWNCDCNLAWLTTCELRDELTEDLKCSSPPNLEDHLIRQIGAEDMVCPPDYFVEQHQKALRIIVVTSGLVGILFCGIIIVIVVKKRKIMEWWYYRKRGSGAVYYVKAKTNAPDIRGDA